jgi:hypothetical protein
MTVAAKFLTAAVLVAQFLSNVEASPTLQAGMQAADGDVSQIVVIAQGAGFNLTEEQFVAGFEAVVAQSTVTRGHPEVYFGHPEVYFGHPEVYFGHPEVYFN